MFLPFAIEFLLTLERHGGGRLLQQAMQQQAIPNFPPNYTVSLSIPPGTNTYCNIVYFEGFDRNIVPNAFRWSLMQYGTRMSQGILTRGFIETGAACFGIITRAEPAVITITNLTNLFQWYESTVAFLSVDTIQDFAIVKDALLRIGTSTRLEALADQSRQALQIIQGSRT